MALFGEMLPFWTGVFLLSALLLALAFEFVNGFHDTANAVATVIYTHSLKPWVAVVWSGLWNLIGVLTSSGAVAFGIVALLPTDLVLHVTTGSGFAMVFALLIGAMAWNLGTWYMGLPASSSHTLIGSIIGVGLAHSWLTPGLMIGEGVNWAKAREVLISLIVSPMIGFCASALLLLLAKWLIRREELYKPADPGKNPPLWIRSILILTCTGVSFAHGSNDGQKGMGLIMLILVGLVPGAFALNPGISRSNLQAVIQESHSIQGMLDKAANGTSAGNREQVLSDYLRKPDVPIEPVFASVAALNRDVTARLASYETFASIDRADRGRLRTDMYLLSESMSKVARTERMDAASTEAVSRYRQNMYKTVEFIPAWVKMAVAFALGLGTMVGWKRIVVTLGEKIGKTHLGYAQGAVAELVAMGTILSADQYGLPVSTTHVLSSGIAGTMFANRSGLQMRTVRNIALAWLLTLPVCVFLGAALFAFALYFVGNVLGVR